MDEVTLISRMRELRKRKRFTATEQALFYELVAIWKTEKAESFFCSNTNLTDRLNIAESSLLRARRNLVKAGLINYHVGKSRRSIGKYSFTDVATDTTTDVATDTTTDMTTLLPSVDKESKKKPVSDKSRSRAFIPPTFEQVEAYCLERKNGINARHFIDHYSTNGWMVGKNKMKDWKACVRTWEQNKQKYENDRSINSKPKDYGKMF